MPSYAEFVFEHYLYIALFFYLSYGSNFFIFSGIYFSFGQIPLLAAVHHEPAFRCYHYATGSFDDFEGTFYLFFDLDFVFGHQHDVRERAFLVFVELDDEVFGVVGRGIQEQYTPIEALKVRNTTACIDNFIERLKTGLFLIGGNLHKNVVDK